MSTSKFLFHEDLIKRWMVIRRRSWGASAFGWIYDCFLTSSDSVSQVWSKDHLYQSHQGCLLKCRFLGLSPDPLNQSVQKQLWTLDFPKAHHRVPIITVGQNPLPREQFLGLPHPLHLWRGASLLGESALSCDAWTVELKYQTEAPEPSWETWARVSSSHGSSFGAGPQVLLHVTDRDAERLQKFLFCVSLQQRLGWDCNQPDIFSLNVLPQGDRHLIFQLAHFGLWTSIISSVQLLKICSRLFTLGSQEIRSRSGQGHIRGKHWHFQCYGEKTLTGNGSPNILRILLLSSCPSVSQTC